MKNILLALLLANVLYYLWGMLGDDDKEPGVALVQESDLGPPLEVRARDDSDTIASVGEVLGAGDATDLDAAVGRSCVTIGPILDQADADSVELSYSAEGMVTSSRKEFGTVFVGHWVQVRNVPDDATAATMLETLHSGGLSDAYKNVTDDEGIKISLGLFGDLERAQNILDQALALDLPADITPRTADRDAYYVDLALPPGTGAAAIVERFGEDKVALRGEASCP